MLVRVHVIYSAQAEEGETPDLEQRAIKVLESLTDRFAGLMREAAADSGIEMTLDMAADQAPPRSELDPRNA
jgi:hypothetical protein